MNLKITCIFLRMVNGNEDDDGDEVSLKMGCIGRSAKTPFYLNQLI